MFSCRWRSFLLRMILLMVLLAPGYGEMPIVPLAPWLDMENLAQGHHMALVHDSFGDRQRNDNHNYVATKVKQKGFMRACYLDYNTKIKLDLIDAHLCTHILAFFSRVHNGTLHLSSVALTDLAKLNKLKEKNPALKIVLTVGGTSEEFGDVASSSDKRKRFTESAVGVVQSHGFDGLDLDWEFPAWTSSFSASSNPADKDNFVLLLKDLSVVLNTTNPELSLSSAVSTVKPIIDASYDIPAIAKYVDFVSLMCYDYHFFKWYMFWLGYNSPLYPAKYDFCYFSTLNVDWSTRRWLAGGMPPEKLLVGIPTYGHTYNLVAAACHQPPCPAESQGFGKGVANYPDVCRLLNSGGQREFDPLSKVPYAFKEDQWVSYEDEQSFRYKAEYIRKMGVAGVMTFSLDADDWIGSCDNTTFPLHKLLKKMLP